MLSTKSMYRSLGAQRLSKHTVYVKVFGRVRSCLHIMMQLTCFVVFVFAVVLLEVIQHQRMSGSRKTMRMTG
jgi:hypothetical protein